MNPPLASALFLLALATPAFADDQGLVLFQPVASDKRKALNSNRPTQVDTAYTVDSGVVQFETGSVIYTRDHSTVDGSHFDSFTLGQTNIRLGVTENFELQTIVTPYVTARRRDASGNLTKDSGLGDTTVRAFYNVANNDGNGLGVAILPYLKLPSNQSDHGLYGNRQVEGGFELPLAYALDAKTSLCTSPGFALETDGRGGRDFNPYVPLTVFRSVSDSVSVFAEVFAKRYTGYGADAWIAQADVGAVWVVTRDFSLDVAVYAGLNKASPDLVVQTGFALRF